MPQNLASLVTALTKARHFEDAAAGVLRAMLDRSARSLASSRFGNRARILRGMVHLRPSDGYQRLVILDHTDPGLTRGKGDPATPELLPSATAWRWITSHQCAVSIDVNLGRVHTHATGSGEMVEEHGRGGLFEGSDSGQRLLERAATHVHVVPLRTPAGVVDGMISIEADCRGAIGWDSFWNECGEDLQLLAAVATPYLGGLPLRPGTAASVDDLLPVVGATMAGIVAMLRIFARQEETILIGGPTGSGKSRLARWCHEQSRRREARFEGLDLMTVPEELQLGELFGWRKGAFTGAIKDSSGSLSRAEGGTLFIDEIDKLSLRAQAGLLHVLDERIYRPLGEGASDRRADVRFVVGTNADLRALVRAGRFREDLYYRINVLPIRLPPLVERPEEILLWARYMADRRHRESAPGGRALISPDAEEILLSSRWPGNLRQLDNIVRRAYAIAAVERDAGGEAGDALRLGSSDVILGRRSFARALDYEGVHTGLSLTDLLEQTAVAFLGEAERRGVSPPHHGGPLNLDLTDALRGLVLGAAVRRLGSRDAAFRLLGKGALVTNRNHHKVLKRELDKVELLWRALGIQESMPFADLMGPDEK